MRNFLLAVFAVRVAAIPAYETLSYVKGDVAVEEVVEWVTVYSTDCCGVSTAPTAIPVPESSTHKSAPVVLTEKPAPETSTTKPALVKTETTSPVTHENEAFKFLILSTMNALRVLHGSAPLSWDDTLGTYAEQHTRACDFHHSYGPYGENLAQGYTTVVAAIQDWYNEWRKYSYDNPGFSMETGHFTQVMIRLSLLTSSLFGRTPKESRAIIVPVRM